MQSGTLTFGFVAVVLLCVNQVFSSQKAVVLLNNSKYYYNYRMVSNVLSIYNMVKNLGFSDDEILSGSNQATFNYPANYPQNTQRMYDDDIKHNLLNEETDLDLSYEDITLWRHLLAFNGRHEDNDPLCKRSVKNNLETYFIYLTGHGGDRYMKIQYLEILFSRHFSDFFEELFVSKKVDRALVMSDTCSAGTLFYTTTATANALLIGSSSWDEHALSEGFDKYIGQPLKDKMSSAFVKILEKFWKTGSNITFEGLIEKFDKRTIESDLLYFNFLGKNKKDIWLREFLEKKDDQNEVFEFEKSSDQLKGMFFDAPSF
jgi:phosphatidylinositol glycan class K